MPDFLICDVILGGIDGVETAHRVLASCPDCRIVLIPGAPVSAEIIQNRQANARRFEILGKPFHPTLLIDVLTSIDSQREKLSQVLQVRYGVSARVPTIVANASPEPFDQFSRVDRLAK